MVTIYSGVTRSSVGEEDMGEIDSMKFKNVISDKNLGKMDPRQKMAASLLFCTMSPRSSVYETKESETFHHRKALTDLNCFAELCPNLFEIIRNGEVPFYSSEEAANTRHKIGGPGTARLQALLDPGGADNMDELPEFDFWDLYPRGRCLDETARAACRPWLPGECSSESARQGHAYSPRRNQNLPEKQTTYEHRRALPAWPATRATASAQKPPTNAKRRSRTRKAAVAVPAKEPHIALQDHPLLLNAAKLRALPLAASSTSDKHDSWGLGLC